MLNILHISRLAPIAFLLVTSSAMADFGLRIPLSRDAAAALSAGTGGGQAPADSGTSAGDPASNPASVPAPAVALTSSTLPSGFVNQSYLYDLATLVSVTGDAAYDGSGVLWHVGSGALPPGITLSETGTLSGVPLQENETGDSFQVVASYKGANGQQAYTIVVGGVALDVVQISAGAGHTCAVTAAGGAKCWGYNYDGRVGDGSSGSSADKLRPVDVLGMTSGVSYISAGQDYTCAVTTGGGAKCWGANWYGQLGSSQVAIGAGSPVPVDVKNLTAGAASISAGTYHTCAVTVSGGAKCWGAGDSGQLGTGYTYSSGLPQDVVGLSGDVTRISAKGSQTCALVSGGVKCWGANWYGGLGDGTQTDRLTPTGVLGLGAGVTDMGSGAYHACALVSGGVKCWGANMYGQLGNGSTNDAFSPVNVTGLGAGVARLSVGTQNVCVATIGGIAQCWGLNNGSSVDNATFSNQVVPTPVNGLPSGVADISANGSFTCVKMTSGKAKCWGYNWAGNIGDGTRDNQKGITAVSP
jgi:alpha-tubulin suppressor-like RCC1 family protein